MNSGQKFAPFLANLALFGQTAKLSILDKSAHTNSPLRLNAEILHVTFYCFLKHRSKIARKREFELSSYRASDGVTFGEIGVHSEAYEGMYHGSLCKYKGV